MENHELSLDNVYKDIEIQSLKEQLKKVTQELNKALEKAEKLDILRAYGVDNWEGYSEAMKEYYND